MGDIRATAAQPSQHCSCTRNAVVNLETPTGAVPLCWECFQDPRKVKVLLTPPAAAPVNPGQGPAETKAAAEATAAAAGLVDDEDQDNPPTIDPELHGFMASIIDGDTLGITLTTAELGRFPMHVRVLGIDAPERGTREGQEATLAVRSILAKTRNLVQLEQDPRHDDRDKWGRLLRHVWVGTSLLSEQLLLGGHAVIDDRFPPTKYDSALRATGATLNRNAPSDSPKLLPVAVGGSPTPTPGGSTPPA